jgi:hypothetical protein
VIQIDDFQLITSKQEQKNFEVTFESLGTGTCMEVDFKDGAVKTYGDQSSCEEWLPDVRYDPIYTEITSPLPLIYVFYQEGIFNVTARAKNRVTDIATVDDVMVIVTSAPCAPPKIMIPFNSTNNLAPVEFFRAEKIVVKANQYLNCTPVLTTTKSWQLFSVTVNISNGAETTTPADLATVAPATVNGAQLIIPALSLAYGTYKLVFTSRMWDKALADPNWTRKLPFSNQASTYIKVNKSPLKCGLIKGGVSLVTRGAGQSLLLEPFLYSQDPDWPDQGYEGMEFRWFCRQTTETWCNFRCPEGVDQLLYENGDVAPPARRLPAELQEIEATVNNTAVYQKGGCFGAGPGAINHSLGMITLQSLQFMKVDTQYEVLMQLRSGYSSTELNPC